MTTPIGDLAAQVAQQLQDEYVSEVLAQGEPSIDEESVMRREARKSIFSKIEFKWRSDDQAILDQIRAGLDRAFRVLFDDAIAVMDEFYGQMRVPDTDPDTGMLRKDSAGRVVWQKDELGNEIEDWDQLTGQDIEKTLADLARLRMMISPDVNHLLAEAVFAKHLFDDAFQDAFAELVEETIPGRNAYASRKTREDKYHAFFRWYLYSHVEAFRREIDNFSRVLDRILYRRTGASGKVSS